MPNEAVPEPRKVTRAERDRIIEALALERKKEAIVADLVTADWSEADATALVSSVAEEIERDGVPLLVRHELTTRCLRTLAVGAAVAIMAVIVGAQVMNVFLRIGAFCAVIFGLFRFARGLQGYMKFSV